MSIEFDSLFDRDSCFGLAGIDPEAPMWNGHAVTWADAEAICDAVASKLQAWLVMADQASELYVEVAAGLSRLGGGDEQLRRDVVVIPAGFWGSVGGFFKEHALEIAIGVVVTAAVVTVVVCTAGGAAAGVAVAAGGMAAGTTAGEKQKPAAPMPPKSLAGTSQPVVAAPKTHSLAGTGQPVIAVPKTQGLLDLKPLTVMPPPPPPRVEQPLYHNPFLPQDPLGIIPSQKAPPAWYTGSDSNVGKWQGGSRKCLSGASDHCVSQGASEDTHLRGKPTQPGPTFESRAVYTQAPCPSLPQTNPPIQSPSAPMPKTSFAFDPEVGLRPVGPLPEVKNGWREILQKLPLGYLSPAAHVLRQQFVSDGGEAKLHQFIQERLGVTDLFLDPALTQAPFGAIPLLGSPAQGKVHFHCGINNTKETVVEGGFALHGMLKDQLAVQPHQIHPDSLLYGLLMVGVEEYETLVKDMPPPREAEYELNRVNWPKQFIHGTFLHDSIEYEAANMKRWANEILATGNPKLKQLHVTFSNGGYVFKQSLERLSPQQRDTVVLITAGTTQIVEKELAHAVYNVIGSLDWPSRVCNGGWDEVNKAVERGDAKVIPQEETKAIIGGHYFTQPEYQLEIIKTIRNDVIDSYEIY